MAPEAWIFSWTALDCTRLAHPIVPHSRTSTVVFTLTGMLAENEHLAYLLIGLENTNLKKPVLLFNPSYLGDIESGPFLLEANYDGSSTIRGEL